MQPPRPLNPAGELRRVGVELEFAGLDVSATVEAVRAEFGGRREDLTEYECRLVDTELGDFVVEYDSALLKQLARREAAGSPDPSWLETLRGLPRSLAAAIGELVVPVEVVSPPLPFDVLPRMDALCARLREAGAKGTTESIAYAFGLHLNPELPDLRVATLVRYTQAFLAAYDWLVQAEDVSWSRSVTPYVDGFPAEYVQHVLRPDYAPDLRGFLDDYLRWNPSRNRALDLLPLLAHLDAERVRAAVDDERVKARPTFHYRLPNCAIDEPGWGVSSAWRRWLRIEALAEDERRLRGLADACLAHLDKALPPLHDWSAEWSRWMDDDRSSA